VGTRRKSREIAIQILYQLEINEADIEDAVATYWDAYQPSRDLKEFSSHILHGVFRHLREIDTIIGKTSNHWSLTRMPAVDRSILRAAIFEILYCPDIPLKVSSFGVGFFDSQPCALQHLNTQWFFMTFSTGRY